MSCFSSCSNLLWEFVYVVSVQWKRLPTSNEPPDARAYHSMTSIGSRFLLFGGFDGKSTYGDLWWLVPEGTDSFPIGVIVCFIICAVFPSQSYK